MARVWAKGRVRDGARTTARDRPRESPNDRKVATGTKRTGWHARVSWNSWARARSRASATVTLKAINRTNPRIGTRTKSTGKRESAGYRDQATPRGAMVRGSGWSGVAILTVCNGLALKGAPCASRASRAMPKEKLERQMWTSVEMHGGLLGLGRARQDPAHLKVQQAVRGIAILSKNTHGKPVYSPTSTSTTKDLAYQVEPPKHLSFFLSDSFLTECTKHTY